jgi:ferredoxin
MEIPTPVRKNLGMFRWLSSWLACRPPPAHACCEWRDQRRPAAAPVADPDRRIVAVLVRHPCTLCLACVSTCPQVFTCDGEQILITPMASDEFTNHRNEIEDAIHGCPEWALAIRYADGTEIPPES